MGGNIFGKRYESPGRDSKLDLPAKSKIRRAGQAHVGEFRAIVPEAHFEPVAPLNLNYDW